MEIQEALSLYRKLALARLAEERIRLDYHLNEMKTPVHLGIGGEAIPVGVCHCLPKKAETFGTYRNHALYLAVTDDTDGFFAELYGKVTGPGKGKAGSMHLSAPQDGLIATSAVVGTTIPLAVGAALAHSYRDQSTPVTVFFGDGAVEEGVFWESLNFSALQKLPVLFVCEDNDLAIHSLRHQRRGFANILDVVKNFECELAEGNGSDIEAVVNLTRDLLKRMHEKNKPGFMHLSYFRFLEHVGINEDFDAQYRLQPAAEELTALDPLARFERSLLAAGTAEATLQAILQEVRERIDKSVAAARSAPFPEPSELHADVWA